jgi:hypothetical protein
MTALLYIPPRGMIYDLLYSGKSLLSMLLL